MPEFSIIIVTWNALHHLKTYLPSVWEYSHHQAEIIIADNASTDGTCDWVTDRFPEIRVVSLEKNFGYCGGNNRAAEYARGSNLLFLNNDVEVTPGWLDPLLAQFRNNPQTIVLQPKIRSWTDRTSFEYAGAAGGFLDRHVYPFCRGRIFETLEIDTGQYDTVSDIAWASGAAMVIRKEHFKNSGGFDESFEFHMEEIDLCWRLKNQGYQIQFCPESLVYHLGSGSLPADSLRKTYYNFRNNLKTLLKNSAGNQLIPRLLIRMALDEIAICRALFRLRFREAGAIGRAQLHFLFAVPAVWRERKKLQSARKIKGDYHMLKPYSLIWQYFFRNRKTFSSLPDNGN